MTTAKKKKKSGRNGKARPRVHSSPDAQSPSGKHQEQGRGASAGAEASAPQAAPPSPSPYELKPVATTVYNNSGSLGTVRPYTVKDFSELVGVVQKAAESVSPLEITLARITTPYATINSPSALGEYLTKEDKVRPESVVQLKAPDSSLQVLLTVGIPWCIREYSRTAGHFQCQLDEEELAYKTFKKMGLQLGKDVGIILLSSLAGGMVGHLSRFLGRAVGFTGATYGLGDLARATYNEFVPTGVCTVVARPSQKEPTAAMVAAYRKFVDTMEKRTNLYEGRK